MKKIGIASMCLAASMLLTACGAFAEPSLNAEAKMPAGTESTLLQGETQVLSEFHSIEIDVMAADIRVIPGEQWAVSYHLSEKEPVKRFGVQNGTLYVETTFNPKERFDRNQDWFVTVTVPETAVLSEVDLETISGNVQVQGMNCDELSMSSTSGDVSAEGITAREVGMESVSGSITGKTISSASLEAETVSGSVSVDGAFAELETETISGSTDVSGSITMEGTLQSTSGNITLSLNHSASISAGSVGGVTLNGEKAKNPLQLQEGAPIKIQSVSGKISIQTGM